MVRPKLGEAWFVRPEEEDLTRWKPKAEEIAQSADQLCRNPGFRQKRRGVFPLRSCGQQIVNLKSGITEEKNSKTTESRLQNSSPSLPDFPSLTGFWR